jgi:transposase-like protein
MVYAFADEKKKITRSLLHSVIRDKRQSGFFPVPDEDEQKFNLQKKYAREVRVLAVRLVSEQQNEYPSRSAAIRAIAEKIGCSPSTLRNWCKKLGELQEQ